MTNCASYTQRVTPVIDGKLLDKCPDLIIWNKNADDVQIGQGIINMASQYKDCQDRQSVLVDRNIEMMKH